ncbi:RNA ligase [Rhodococcus phage NiceHouse]|nr:RNA ligase [Rhodococcus phage NiceHouse]
MYEDLDIDLSSLGCIMLDLEPIKLTLPTAWLYKSEDERRFWIDGLVGQKPHATLLYGLLPGVKKWHVDSVLEDWWTGSVRVKSIGFFDSPYEDDPYYCIVAHLDSLWDNAGDSLTEANERLSLLPHVKTFSGYKAHVTLAYIRRDEKILKDSILALTKQLDEISLATKQLNYGGKIN